LRFRDSRRPRDSNP